MKTKQNSCGAGRVPVSRRSRATTCCYELATTSSTSSERCSQTDQTCRFSRPRYKYAATITLASGTIPHHL